MECLPLYLSVFFTYISKFFSEYNKYLGISGSDMGNIPTEYTGKAFLQHMPKRNNLFSLFGSKLTNVWEPA